MKEADETKSDGLVREKEIHKETKQDGKASIEGGVEKKKLHQSLIPALHTGKQLRIVKGNKTDELCSQNSLANQTKERLYGENT